MSQKASLEAVFGGLFDASLLHETVGYYMLMAKLSSRSTRLCPFLSSHGKYLAATRRLGTRNLSNEPCDVGLRACAL